MNMISLKINTDELRKNMNFEEVAELTEQLLDEAEEFENVTKGELVRIMAEKLEEAGYPLKEIREKIDERMHGKISRQHISQSLHERFKNPKKVAAGRATREAHKQQQQQQTNTGAGGLATMTVETPLGVYDDDDDDDGNGDDVYTGKPAVIKIQKMDDTMLNRLYGATTRSAEHTYLLVNPQTGSVEEIYSDIEYDNQRGQQ